MDLSRNQLLLISGFRFCKEWNPLWSHTRANWSTDFISSLGIYHSEGSVRHPVRSNYLVYRGYKASIGIASMLKPCMLKVGIAHPLEDHSDKLNAIFIYIMYTWYGLGFFSNFLFLNWFQLMQNFSNESNCCSGSCFLSWKIMTFFSGIFWLLIWDISIFWGRLYISSKKKTARPNFFLEKNVC